MSDSPGAAKSCPKCGSSLPSDAAEGLCPRCLMGEAMQPTGPKQAWEPPTAAELAELLPEYDVHKLLGRGGMGAVYKGTQKSLDRPVAIKILSATLDESDQGFADRFKNEARALAKLKHPSIVGVYDFGTAADGLLYIVMEYIDGTDVSRMIAKEGRLHTDHAMAITAHVCDALIYAHERGIIHRDIKPANIMVAYDGNVKVADFGLAKMTHAAETGLTQSGMAMGTLHYMAPECLMLGSAVDHRADIYAVGVMLYQMLTGKLPKGVFKLPSLQIKGLDPRYDGIIAKALREDREARYQTILEMRADLDGILTQPILKVDEVAEAHAAAPIQNSGTAQPPTEEEIYEEQYRRRQSSERISLAIAVMLVLLGGLFLFWPRTKGDRSNETPTAITSREDAGKKPAGTTTPPPAVPAVPVNPPTDKTANPPSATPASPPTVATVQPAPHPKPTAPSEPPSAPIQAAPAVVSSRIDGLVADGEWHDILERLDRTRTKVKGPWKMTPDGLELPDVVWAGIIGMPTEPLDRFEARIRFTSNRHDRFNVRLPSPSSAFAFSFCPHRRTIGLNGNANASANPSNERPMDKMSATTGDTHEVRIAVTPFTLSVLLDGNVVYEMAPVDWADCASKEALLGLYLHQGRGVFHSFDIRIPSAGSLPPADVPEIQPLIAAHQKARQQRLAALTNAHQQALTLAEAESVKSGDVPPLISVRQIMKQVAWRMAEIEKLPGALLVAPLTLLPAPPEDAPDSVRQRCPAYDLEVRKIEFELAAAFDRNLESLQSSLLTSGNTAKAREVELYRQAVTPHGIALSSLTSPLLDATPEAPFVNSLGMKFLPLPDSGVLMGMHEVRWKDYAAYAEDAQDVEIWWKDQSIQGFTPTDRLDEHPVTKVNWHDAQKFCEWLSKKEGRTYRLPTDLEWSTAVGLTDREHHSRDDTPESAPKHPDQFPWGKQWPPPPAVGNFHDQSRTGTTLDVKPAPIAGYDDGFPTTAPVMSFPPNRLGFHDLSGNVWEWCLDWTNAEQKLRVLRGGSFQAYQAGGLRSDRRYRFGPNARFPDLGFRCVLDLQTPPTISAP